MNPVLEQFLVEGRELIDAAVQLLLKLEQRPDDAAKLNELFRLVHTLKGNSGLFGFVEYTSLVHHAENELDLIRNGGGVLDRKVIDVLLQTCDVLSEMTDEIEGAGAISRALADRAAALVASLGGTPAKTRSTPEEGKEQPARRFHVRYTPDPNCFFKGEDPLYTMTQLPGFESLSVQAEEGAALTDDYDVFRAHVSLTATALAKRSDIDEVVRYVSDQVEIESADEEMDTEDRAALTALLAAQRAVLRANPHAGALRGVVATLKGVTAFANMGAGFPDQPADRAAVEAFIDTLEQRLDTSPASAPNDGDAGGPWHDAKAAPTEGNGKPSRYLRIEQGRVDRLMELVGEMVVAKNGLPYIARRIEGGEPPREVARDTRQQYAGISRIADEMQDAVMRMRMMPVSSIAQRFPRLVRDISQRLGKDVEFSVQGEDTEADKNIIEALSDPLLHIVRNSLDHGLESPSDRVAAGKPAKGRLAVSAHQESDKIAIEIVDDGRGIDTERVRRKAVDQGLVSADDAASMPDHDLLQLIFAPGFSTASSVTDLSGRGVGMDVVKTTVERLRGQVSVASTPGQGTSIRITLPLSIAVSHVMVIRCAGQAYGIPMDAVVETVRLGSDSMQQIKRHWAALLRGRIVPLLELSSLLGLPEAGVLGLAQEVAVLLVRTRHGVTGLVVDGFDNSMDVILKPMEGVLADIAGYAGTALLGDGSVLMILNTDELI